MRGMRPPTDDEMAKVVMAFTGRFWVRNLVMLLWLYYLGWRISELLSLTWGDVLLPGGEPQGWVSLQRRYRKGKREGMTRRVTPAMAQAIVLWRDARLKMGMLIVADEKVWPISRQMAWKAFAEACDRAGIGRRGIGCHGWRKKHGLWVYQVALDRLKRGEGSIDPMRAAAQALGHASVASTEKYLPVDHTTVILAQESMPNLVDTLSIERNGARENRPVSMCPLQST